MARKCVGVGFVTMLTGAAAERFVARDLAEDADEMERELDEAAAAMLQELRDVRGRLDALEATVRRTGWTPRPEIGAPFMRDAGR